ncbi:hypothetical protein RDWZM_000905 [Blomia tropicalis]|uniref:Major facilitator superfamily (MFS) profile domain-containing protein n=1 Tax=Blomia tropicalis TaxID=40697 RepID=A0A9Q0MAM5_BLOTA|nr:hypothetical protein RDWZM_000905 [Blomia tropicalis]
MSVTIVAMVNQTTNSDSTMVKFDFNQTIPQLETIEDDDDDVFDWDETMQGHILGSFYYGYIASNINAGQLVDRVGARWLCGIITLASAMLTMITPLVARWDVNALILVRVCIGLCQGILTPAIYSLLAKWIPRNERALVLALIQVGGNMGAVVSTILSGFLCQHGFDGGWPSVFYVFGIVGILCFILWIYAIYDTPDQHPRIDDEELEIIQLNIGVNNLNEKKVCIPWISILTSMPVWAITVAKFCGAWGNLMLMSKLPSYLKSVLHLPIHHTIALGGPAICLIMIPIVGCNLPSLVALLIVAMTIFGLNAGGDKINVVDISLHYSGTIYGITNAIASIPGILSPLVVGFLINLHGGIQGWNLVFYSAAGVYIFGIVFFLIFATAKRQPWDIEPQSKCSTMDSKKYSKNNSRVLKHIPNGRTTFIHDIPTNGTSRETTPNQSRKFSINSSINQNIFTIDLYTVQHQLDNKCEIEPEMANISNEMQYNLCIDDFDNDNNLNSYDLDDKNETVQQLQHVYGSSPNICPIV